MEKEMKTTPEREAKREKKKREGPRVRDCDASCLKTSLIVRGGAWNREVQRDENKNRTLKYSSRPVSKE